MENIYINKTIIKQKYHLLQHHLPKICITPSYQSHCLNSIANGVFLPEMGNDMRSGSVMTWVQTKQIDNMKVRNGRLCVCTP